MDSVETVIRLRQGPPEGDNTSVTISIVLDVSTGYIMKNGSGWWCTWVGEGDSISKLGYILCMKAEVNITRLMLTGKCCTNSTPKLHAPGSYTIEAPQIYQEWLRHMHVGSMYLSEEFTKCEIDAQLSKPFYYAFHLLVSNAM